MKKLILIISACAVCLQLPAQSFELLNVNPDAATAGVASTSVAKAANAYAIENNIASASLSESKLAVDAGYAIWKPQDGKVGVISAAGFYKFGSKFAMGLGFKHFTEPSYNATSSEGRLGDSYTPKEMAISLGASYLIIPSLSAGVSVKYLNSNIASEAKASTVAADVSLAYSAKGFSAGISANNLGGKLTYKTKDGDYSYSLPTMFKGGVAYSIVGLTASAEVDYILNSGLMAGIGAEYWIMNVVAVRAGYHYGAEKAIPSYASVGLGAKFFGVDLNATYLLASKTLGNTLMFGLGYSF